MARLWQALMGLQTQAHSKRRLTTLFHMPRKHNQELALFDPRSTRISKAGFNPNTTKDLRSNFQKSKTTFLTPKIHEYHTKFVEFRHFLKFRISKIFQILLGRILLSELIVDSHRWLSSRF